VRLDGTILKFRSGIIDLTSVHVNNTLRRKAVCSPISSSCSPPVTPVLVRRRLAKVELLRRIFQAVNQYLLRLAGHVVKCFGCCPIEHHVLEENVGLIFLDFKG